MAIITVNELKHQLQIDPSDTTDDAYLAMVIETATEMVFNKLRRTQEDLVAEVGAIPSSLKSAALIFGTNIYENRGSIAFAQSYRIPDHLDVMLTPYKNYLVG
jgi:hypothetical protein